MELGYGQKELAKKLDMTHPGVVYAVIKGEATSKINHLEQKTGISYLFMSAPHILLPVPDKLY
jgi:hypothetical protein